MSPRAAKCSILIVEDEPIVARDLQLILRDLGYDAFAIAKSADEALKRAAERCPDLVLMDIRIKGKLDGIETAEILRTRFGVSVVYLTAHADEATIERAAKTQPYGYLLKPINANELRGAVEIGAYRQRLDRSMRERERRFSAALQSVQDAVITTDSAGQVTFMNTAAETLLGTNADAAVGRPANEVLQLVDRDSVVAQTTNLPGESGQEMAGNDSTGTLMVLHDVGERKKLQRQLELADRLSSLGAMAASTAHELNNPLTVVMTNSGLIGDELRLFRDGLAAASNELAQSRLARIHVALGDLQAAASRMARIIGDLRGFTRPAESGPIRIDLRRCVEWSIRATAHEFQHRAHIRTRFLPAPAVIGEPARVEQVLVNLLVNAAHAIAPGNVDANEVNIVVRTAEDGRALIEVRDTGGGIEHEALQRIFDPFFTTKDAGTGTGLGLAICQGIIRAMGGDIAVASEPGRGTVFTILLQAAPPAEREVAAPPAPRPDLPSKPGRILVIDDEVILLRAIQNILQDDGHHVTCRDDPRSALALLEQGESFDLILSDLMMPSMTGMDLYETLLSRLPAAAHKIVFITGGAITPRMAAFLESIPNARLEKPFRIEQLCATVRRSMATTAPGPVGGGISRRMH
jgi:signal transduction histidine kinase